MLNKMLLKNPCHYVKFSTVPSISDVEDGGGTASNAERRDFTAQHQSFQTFQREWIGEQQ